MNAPFTPFPDLGTLALAALGATATRCDGWTPDVLAPCAAALRGNAGARDRRLVALADAMRLSDGELLAVALCVAADRDAQAARAIAAIQAPLGGSKPLVGAVATALAPLGLDAVTLATGPAAAAHVIELGNEPVALPERSIGIALPLLAALSGRASDWEEARFERSASVMLPERIVAEARLRAGLAGSGLVLRTASRAEATSLSLLIGEQLGLRPVHVNPLPSAALAPWLIASASLPVFTVPGGPGERWTLPAIGTYRGPWLLLTGTGLEVEADPGPDDWTIGVPPEAERAALWRGHGLSRADALRAAQSYRQGAGRIAEAAGQAKRSAARRGRARARWDDVVEGVASGAAVLSAHARPSTAAVDDASLVLPPALDDALHRLLARARARSTLGEALGPAVRARYRPGVRALFTGESGTGKTLAVHWLAGQLGLPLYRVDMAALTSKWIGETEKNLSSVLDAAEHADVLLLFDEADALFGARTEIGDSNDRHANAQTNFLLQRIEDFDGLAVLTSNNRDRFDPAFTRRLDAILEFPMPEGAARRRLWAAHLGDAHGLGARELDQLALRVDLAGGHIRGIVLAAAARAHHAGRAIEWADVVASTAEEYGKLGRPPPALAP